MAQLIEYKCPCCGGAVEFNTSVQKMKCPYCDTEFEMDVLQAYNEDLQSEQGDNMTWESQPGNEWQEGDTDGMRVYICQSCAGEIIGDENMGEGEFLDVERVPFDDLVEKVLAGEIRDAKTVAAVLKAKILLGC